MIPDHHDFSLPALRTFSFLRALLPIWLAILVSGLSTLSGCTTVGPTAPTAKPEIVVALGNANRLLYLNQYNEAGLAYLAIADQLSPPYRQQQLKQAGIAFFKAGNTAQFEATIAKIDLNTADRTTRIDVLWLQIDHYMIHDQFSPVANLLNRLATEEIAASDRERLERTRLALSMANKDWLGAMQARTALRPFLTEDKAQLDNVQAIWKLINQIDFADVALRMPPLPDELGGWIELVYFLKYPRITPPQLANDLQLWQLRYPGHPAIANLESRQRLLLSNSYNPPKQVALLLPLNSRFQHYAEILRDGFIAGYLAQLQTDKPIVRIYDIGDDPANVIPVYRQAVTDGADFVVGPLDKEAFEKLVASDEIRTPMIGLNYLAPELTLPPAVFQFGLLPEDEAIEIARHAYIGGYRTALVLVPDTELGKRHSRAFIKAFAALGGTVLAETDYPAAENDFSNPILRLLKASPGTARRPASTNAPSTGGADFIFVAGSAEKLRLIRPQLKFHYAGSLQVFSPSSVHSSAIDPRLDNDLNGIRFVDTPWQLSGQTGALRTGLSAYWNERLKQLGNFFALGYDAAQLVSEIPQLLNDSSQLHQGLTGRLSISPTNAINRQLDLGVFARGVPRVVP